MIEFEAQQLDEFECALHELVLVECCARVRLVHTCMIDVAFLQRGIDRTSFKQKLLSLFAFNSNFRLVAFTHTLTQHRVHEQTLADRLAALEQNDT